MPAEAAASRFSTDRSDGAELGHDPAAVEDQRAVADLRDLLEVGRDDDDRGAGGQRHVEQAVDLRLRADVDAGGRILEDVDLAGEMQPAADHDLLLVAAGEQLDRHARIVRPQADLRCRARARLRLSRPGAR